jgi:hypothetical protein
MGIPYRVGQFLRSVFPHISSDERQLVTRFLPPALTDLFFNMSRADQVHSLRVLQDLMQDGHDDPDLLAAALLHDVGKSLLPLNPLQRAFVVLANRLAPGWVIRMGQAKGVRGLRNSLSTAVHHPRWGAELVSQHGGSARLIRLIRCHQDPADTSSLADLKPYIALLQRADNRN